MTAAPKIRDVEAHPDHTLTLKFAKSEIRVSTSNHTCRRRSQESGLILQGPNHPRKPGVAGRARSRLRYAVRGIGRILVRGRQVDRSSRGTIEADPQDTRFPIETVRNATATRALTSNSVHR